MQSTVADGAPGGIDCRSKRIMKQFADGDNDTGDQLK